MMLYSSSYEEHMLFLDTSLVAACGGKRTKVSLRASQDMRFNFDVLEPLQ